MTDASARAALATVRSLGRAGYPVYVVAADLPALASVSRYVRGAARIDLRKGAGALDALAAYADKIGAGIVIPIADDSMRPILERFGSRIGSAVIAGPTLPAYESLTDKSVLLELARGAGIPLPRTVRAQSWDEVCAAASGIGFPCALKPHRSVVGQAEDARHVYVRMPTDAAALARLAGEYPPEAFPLLVQERIVGPGEGVFLLMHEGRRLAVFAHRRLREFPPSGGASTYRESIPAQADEVRAAEALLRAVDWTGPAMVEFKRCEKTGVPYLMEVNGRFWGSLQLALDAGVDFPTLLARAVLGEVVTPVESYAVGVRTRWLWGDVDTLLARLRHGNRRERLTAFAQFLVFRPGDHIEPWDFRDPAPFWFEGKQSMGSHMRSLKNRGRR